MREALAITTRQGLDKLWADHRACHEQLWAGLSEMGESDVMLPLHAMPPGTVTLVVTHQHTRVRQLILLLAEGLEPYVENPDERLVTVNTIKVCACILQHPFGS
jgi:aspartate aminotransferase-like enzyme